MFDIADTGHRVLNSSGDLNLHLGGGRTELSDRHRDDGNIYIRVLIDSQRSKTKEATQGKKNEENNRGDGIANGPS